VQLGKQAKGSNASFGLDDAIGLMGSLSLATQAKPVTVEDQIRAFDVLKAQPDTPLSLAVSLPFCPALDLTCDRASIVGQRVEEYSSGLIAEIISMAAHLGPKKSLKSIHVFGASANYISDIAIGQIFSVILDRFDLASDSEISFELDPRRTSRSQLGFLRGLGVTELKLQVRDMDPTVQDAIGRYQSAELLEDVIQIGRKLGFDSIGVDQIFGLPCQTSETFASSLESLISLAPDWVECHQFVKRARHFPHQAALLDEKLPSLAEKLMMYNTLNECMDSAGYMSVGLNFFVQPTHRLARSFTDGEVSLNAYGYHCHQATAVLGAGLAAISELPGLVLQNPRTSDLWQQSVAHGQLTEKMGLVNDNEQIEFRHLLRQLMCNQRVSLNGGEKPLSAQPLSVLVQSGLVEYKQDMFGVTEYGRELLPQLLMDSSPTFRSI
jgi:oxygen-independent coproporphyrinogen-3 oxidase